eukprot:scaffold18438_cov61-Phaeocystis_antarctica.AAC.5
MVYNPRSIWNRHTASFLGSACGGLRKLFGSAADQAGAREGERESSSSEKAPRIAARTSGRVRKVTPVEDTDRRLRAYGGYTGFSVQFRLLILTIQERRWEPPRPATQRDALRVQQKEPCLRPPEANHPGLEGA